MNTMILERSLDEGRWYVQVTWKDAETYRRPTPYRASVPVQAVLDQYKKTYGSAYTVSVAP